jgi:LPXTG-site transpeptidase (sortase) family protein
VAEPISSGGSSRVNWRGRLAGIALILVGVGSVAVGALAYLDAWTTSEQWAGSEEAQALARQEGAPTPVWIEPGTPVAVPARIEPLPTPIPFSETPLVRPTPEPALAQLAQLALDNAEFRFLDPPEPDAHARVAITVRNTADGPSERILLGIPKAWFEQYRIIGSVPLVSEDRTDDVGLRTFSFPPVPPSQTVTYELHVAPIGEEVRPPSVQVMVASGETLGSDAPVTLAPPPRPGPVMGLDIPRLKLKTGVVQTKWEPPPFTVGQIRDSASVTKGNTILIGHLSGAAGNVFGHLDQLELGDKVTATSRGLPYEFVVSRIVHSSNMDTSPMKPAEDARLTLMTCAGIWNPITRDYSERLWVIAEPEEQAVVTIATVSATVTAEAIATGTAIALLPTATPTLEPFVGEPALPGGLGNSRSDLAAALGGPPGETPGKLVVFRQASREYHVQFTPDPPRAAMLVVLPSTRLTFDAAVRESRKFFPTDASPRTAGPEGNSQFVVERFSSTLLARALELPLGEFSVIYVRDQAQGGAISRIVLGLGDDVDALLEAARH